MKLLVFGSNGLVGSSLKRIFENSRTFKDHFFSTRRDTNLFNFEETFNSKRKENKKYNKYSVKCYFYGRVSS